VALLRALVVLDAPVDLSFVYLLARLTKTRCVTRIGIKPIRDRTCRPIRTSKKAAPGPKFFFSKILPLATMASLLRRRPDMPSPALFLFLERHAPLLP
jgi:hypothetical protein